jgi:L-iditol 2-dehydrogenase
MADARGSVMRAAVYHNNRDIRIEERPVPAIGPRELLVRVESSGICGSDVMEWYRVRKAPLVLGHEIAGVIVERGDAVERFEIGDRVFVSHHVPCNACRYCAAGQHSLCDTLRSTNFDPGGFAEYIRIPEINVALGTFRLPDEVSFDEGVFIEPLACVVRGLRIARFRKETSVLVLGSGISGLLFVKLLRAFGAEMIVATDVERSRLDAARRFGADHALTADEATPERLRELNGGRGYDLVAVCAGVPAVVALAFRATDRGATVLLFAPLEPGTEIPLALFDIWRDQITIVSTYAGCPVDIEQAIELLHRRRVSVDDMITQRLPLSKTAAGFALVAEGRESIKVVIKPQE